MQVNVIGVDHCCAAAVREKAAFTESHMLDFSSIIMELGAAEAVILSTCNRSEVYYLLPEAAADEQAALRSQIQQTYLEYFQAAQNPELAQAVHCLSGSAAVRHIFRVAAGLESAIIGEDEILRQLKRAYEFAHRFHNTDKVFNHLFQEAIKCAKEVKSSLKISEIPLSPGYIGLKYLEECCGGFAGKKLLLIGYGEIGQLFFRYARELPLAGITICNRSSEAPLAACAEEPRANYLPSGQAREVLPQMDLVITATSCPHLILRREDMLPRSSERPLYLLDMAIPRNIDEGLNSLPNYQVANIDVLKDLSARNEASRRRLTLQAEQLIDRYIEDFDVWLARSGQDGVIKSLNQSVDEIAAEHLKYLFQKIDVTERERTIISRTMQSALRKAVRNPIISLKSMDDADKRRHYSQVLSELFNGTEE